MTDFIAGEVFAIDKPYEWTSFGVVARARRLVTERLQRRIKIGHAGTLDPLATGVIILCTGRATKLIEQYQAHTKEYVATLKLGATTPSFDCEHPEDAVYPTDHITRPMVEQVLANFIGTIQQVPPAYSACKVNGQHAYHLARKGREVEIKAKTLVIDEIELLAYSQTELTLRVVCSKGTYIRALARDIGQALGSGAYLTALRRTRIGDITLDKCMQIDDLPQWLAGLDINPDNFGTEPLAARPGNHTTPTNQ